MSELTHISDLLLELDRLLTDERLALRQLDTASIDRIAKQKLEVVDHLKEIWPQSGVGGDDATATALQRVRDKQLQNQLLLVHARDCVRGVLSQVIDLTPNPIHPSSPPPLRPIARLDVSG